ncbi:MAG: efflux RND transporter periplasmic adaptor subunit [Gammaproteobacteria bacterium]|nr:efflux RND transporter periplasmic adaptor subunit [Gammaproteobacteria bacterium]
MSLDKGALESLRLDRGSDPQRYREPSGRRARWLIVGGAGVLLIAVFAWRMVNSAVPVQTAVVEAPAGGADGTVLNASGYVVARRLATVSSKVTGRISEVLFEEGSRVQEGQVLARLDPATARAEYDVASRSLEASRRNLREIEVRLADARRTYDRNRSLVERKLVAQSVLDSSQADVAALEARLAAAQAEVGVAQSQVALSAQGLEDLSIRAPFTGVVISKDAQPGETVSPMSAGGGFTRTGIATIVDMDSREIEVDVNEAYINRVHDGQKVGAVLDAYPDWTIPGHVISIVPTADRQKATVRVRIAFDELDDRILPDMGIKVRFRDEKGPATAAHPTIPDSAVVRDGRTTSVWVVRDGKVEKRGVELGAAQGGNVPVLKGLEGGESVVVNAPRRLRDGAAVELKGS